MSDTTTPAAAPAAAPAPAQPEPTAMQKLRAQVARERAARRDAFDAAFRELCERHGCDLVARPEIQIEKDGTLRVGAGIALVFTESSDTPAR